MRDWCVENSSGRNRYTIALTSVQLVLGVRLDLHRLIGCKRISECHVDSHFSSLPYSKNAAWHVRLKAPVFMTLEVAD
jgi:hypothetical protein